MQSVGVFRNGRWIIRDINLSVSRGEIVSLIGPNGSGKTTVTKVLTESIKPDAGSTERARGVRIGYVPQKINIDAAFPITVRRLIQIPYPVDDGAIDEVLDDLDIHHLSESPIQKLSGGEYQRAMFARALLRKPDLLILDEPTQGLDFQGESKLYSKMAQIRNRLNCGVLLVCHNLHMVMAQTDTVVCMNVHVCCTGTPKQVKTSDAYLNLFGLPAGEQSHALYSHSHNHSHNFDGTIVDSESAQNR